MCGRSFRGLFFMLMRRTLSCKEARSYFVPMLEHLFNHSADEPTREPSSEEPERKGVFYPVFEDTRGGTVRLESVSMLPIGKWAGNLDIAEKAAHFVVQMFGNPAASKWPSSKP